MKKTIFFDVGGTLIDSPSSPIPIWRELLSDLGLHADPQVVKEALQDADKTLIPQIYSYKGRISEFWLQYDRLVLEKLHISDSYGKYSREIERGFDRPEWFRLFPDSRETLQYLKDSQYRLAVISNNTDDVYKHLDWFGLRKYFDDITYSQEAGAEKARPCDLPLGVEASTV